MEAKEKKDKLKAWTLTSTGERFVENDLKKRSDSKVEIPQEMSGLIQKHHDILIADSSLSDIDVILTILYLMEHQNREAGIKYDECKELFVSLGRKEDNFRKILHKGKKDSLLKGVTEYSIF